MMEDIVQTRIKCLELAHRHDLTPQAIVDRAKCYEQYAIGNVEQSENQNRAGLTGRRGRPPSNKPAERLD